MPSLSWLSGFKHMLTLGISQCPLRLQVLIQGIPGKPLTLFIRTMVNPAGSSRAPLKTRLRLGQKNPSQAHLRYRTDKYTKRISLGKKKNNEKRHHASQKYQIPIKPFCQVHFQIHCVPLYTIPAKLTLLIRLLQHKKLKGFNISLYKLWHGKLCICCSEKLSRRFSVGFPGSLMVNMKAGGWMGGLRQRTSSSGTLLSCLSPEPRDSLKKKEKRKKKHPMSGRSLPGSAYPIPVH